MNFDLHCRLFGFLLSNKKGKVFAVRSFKVTRAIDNRLVIIPGFVTCNEELELLTT